MDPEIRHLRAICTIAEAGSLSRAAVRLGISQPALTALLQRVERSIGGELFIRSRTGVRPTQLGERALERARLVLAELDSFVGDLARPGESSVIRMGSAHLECVGTMMENVRDSLIGKEVTLRVEPSAVALAQSIAHDRLDVALVGMVDDQDVQLATELAQRTLIPRLPVFVAISAAHALASHSSIALADLAGESWISPPGADDGSLASLRAACRRAGFAPRIRYQAPSGGGRQLIESGQAVQLTEPCSTGTDRMAIRPLEGTPMWMRIVLCWRRNRLTDEDADTIFRAAAHAYNKHAMRSPSYRPWWEEHPELHPRTT